MKKIMKKIEKAIWQSIEAHPAEAAPLQDMFSYIREDLLPKKQTESDVHTLAYKAARAEAFSVNYKLRPYIQSAMDLCASREQYETVGVLDELMFKSYLLSAQDIFDDYLQAVEYWKPLAKQFYRPRRHYLKRYVDAYQDVLEGKLDFLSISMPKRTGKAVTLDTLIPTPFGFKRMGEIQVGDLVIAKDGYETRATDVFPQGKVPVYEVKFSDGAVVKTCAEHLWKVKVHDINKGGGSSYSEKVLTTGDMLKHGVKGGKGRGLHSIYAVEYTEPVEFIYRDVELDPYVLGALLGDGSFTDSTISITCPDKEITDYIASHLPKGDVMYCQDEKKSRYLIKSEKHKTDKRGFLLKSETAMRLERLGLLGKKSETKHVPADYVYNTSVMRWEFLAGLLDTDGCACRKEVEYSTASPDLRDAVVFIVRSLGGKCSWTERMGRYKKDGVIHETRPNYRLHIYFPSGVNPFKLKRKADVYSPKREKLYHYIESITPCGEEEAQCIRVDDPDHLFLVTDYFVPTHNSQLGINFTNMLSGRKPNNSTLMEGTGDALIKSFYKGCLEYLDRQSEYSYYDIFPNLRLSETNADMKTINLDRRSRFPTIMCRSIDSSQVGLSEATNLLYLDDCVEGREEAKNRTRLDAKWEVISGDIVGRAIEGTPIVICGTRYSLYDPIGRLQETMREQGKRMKVIEIPALDPITDESNFEYVREGRRIFTTAYFRNQRKMLSAEQWESEFQQQPFEAKGLMFPKDQLNYYYELPVDKEPDTVVFVCDTAEDGSDFLSMPIARVYGDEVYVDDVIFDDSPAMVTKPECAKAIIDNHAASGTFESNNAGSYFAKDVQELLTERGYKCGIRLKRSISNKQTRIEFASDNIIKHFWFKHPSTYERGSQYDQFMHQVTTHTRSGKVEHDDAPDSLAMLENELRSVLTPPVEVFRRPF